MIVLSSLKKRCQALLCYLHNQTEPIMKKLILFIAGAAFSMAVAHAQSDSSRNTSAGSPTQTTTTYQNYPTKDMKKLAPTEIPASLRTTLQGSEYDGWENGTIYFNSMTNEYVYEPQPRTEDNTSAQGKKRTTWYRFDKSGKRIPDTRPR
jgi:hypothetical protein